MTPETVALLLGLGLLAAAVLWGVAALRRRLTAIETQRTPDAALALLQREIEAVRGETRREHESTLAAVHQDVARFGGQVGERLAQLQGDVAAQLQRVMADVSR